MIKARVKRDAVLYFGLFSIFSISIFLRLYELGASSYWIDELVSVHFAKHPYWGALFWDNSPFLYNFLLKIWILAFGDSESTTRTLSVIFSVGTTMILFRLGKKLAGLPGALVMGGLHSISLLSIFYAQETRMYAMFEFFAALSMNFFFEILEGEKSWTGFALSAPFLSLSSYLSIVPLGLESLWLFFQKIGTPAKKKIFFIGFLVSLFVISVSYISFFSWPHLAWQKYKFEAEPLSHWPGNIIWSLCNSNVLSCAGFGILGINFIFNYKKWGAKNFKIASLSGLFVVVSLAAFQVASLIDRRAVFLPRYFVFLIPYFIIWTALPIVNDHPQKKWRKISMFLAFGAVILGTLLTLPTIYQNHKSPWREAAKLVALYPDSTGLTTRTLAIKTPYFERIGVNVEKWEPDNQKLEFVLSRTQKYSNVWMIENYFGGIQYFDKLTERLKEHKLQVQAFTLAAGKAEPILLLRIFKKK